MDKEKLLYDYFSNDLNPEQERQLEKLLATDTEFKEQFDFERDLKRAIEDTEREKLKSKLVGFETEISRDSSISVVRALPRRKFQKWAMAASIALLLGLGWLGYTNLVVTDYAELYEDNFQKYPNTVYPITRGDTEDSEERKAFTAYESENYTEAIGLFELMITQEYRPYLDFYLGQCHLKLDSPVKALPYLKAATSSDSEFAAEAHWYLAMAYLKLENREQARAELMQLTETSDYKKEKAQALLEELD